MKNFFSIAVTSLILISGMHMAVAKHYCHGELAAMKITFTGEKATCGMEDGVEAGKPFDNKAVDLITAKCCSNESLLMGVDQNYNPSYQEFSSLRSLPLFAYVPLELIYSFQNSSVYNYKNIIPPENVPAGAKGPADICVFRI
jgi:hypothetical protein